MLRTLRPLTFLGLALLPLAGAPAIARDEDDHDRARAAMQAGQIRPLAELLAIVEKRYVGQVVETELDHDDGRWTYEFKLMPPTGRMYKIELDAATAEVVDTDGPVQERR